MTARAGFGLAIALALVPPAARAQEGEADNGTDPTKLSTSFSTS